jgi:hypothetical protein
MIYQTEQSNVTLATNEEELNTIINISLSNF